MILRRPMRASNWYLTTTIHVVAQNSAHAHSREERRKRELVFNVQGVHKTNYTMGGVAGR